MPVAFVTAVIRSPTASLSRQVDHEAPAAAVEAEPSDPEQSGADHSERQIVRCKIFAAIAVTTAQHDRGDEAAHAGAARRRLEIQDGVLINSTNGSLPTPPGPR